MLAAMTVAAVFNFALFRTLLNLVTENNVTLGRIYEQQEKDNARMRENARTNSQRPPGDGQAGHLRKKADDL